MASALPIGRSGGITASPSSSAVTASLDGAVSSSFIVHALDGTGAIPLVVPTVLHSPARGNITLRGCNLWSIVGCGAAVGATTVACGGPEDVPCILAAVGAISGCGQCFCQSVGCPSGCPCASSAGRISQAASGPSGTYVGTKNVLGVSVTATIEIDDAATMDFSITGAASVSCAGEAYSVASSGAMTLPTDEGSCIHDALSKQKLSDLDAAYDSSADAITVTLKDDNLVKVGLVLSRQSVLGSVRGTGLATVTTVYTLEQAVASGDCDEVELPTTDVAAAQKVDANLKVGTCASVGYSVADGTMTKTVPVLGTLTIRKFKKAAA